MNKDVCMPLRDFQPSFLSYSQDYETILKKLFVMSKPYSDKLKQLLVINAKDAADNFTNSVYAAKLHTMTLAELKNQGYIRLEPKLTMSQHEQIKSYILVSFNNYTQNFNNEFRDSIISFDILCHTDYWDLGNFRIRPLEIAGYIDGILNKARLKGIGRLEFVSCKQLLLDEVLSGYTLTYKAVHGSDDVIPDDDN